MLKTKNKNGFAKYGRYIGYGIGATGLDLSYGLFYSYLSKYLTDILLMPASFLLILTPIARVWDGINDPIMGAVADSARMRMGKYRPWIVIGATTNAAVLFMLFTNPGIRLGSAALYVYVAVMYVLWGMTNTMADIPYWSMVPSFTSDPNERDIISTIARTFSGIGQGIITIFTPLALALLGGAPDGEKKINARGMSGWALVCSVLLVVFACVCAGVTKEKNVVRSKEKFSFKKVFENFKTNDQLPVFMLFAMLSNAGWYLTSGVAVYYFENVEGDATKLSAFAAFGAIGSFLGLFVIPLMSKRYARRQIYRFSLRVVMIGYAAMFVCGPLLHRMLLLDLAYIFASVGMASMFVNQTVILADIVDYGEYKTGVRRESLTFSTKGFLQKAAYTLQTVILFSGLGLSGYDGSRVVQNPLANATIGAMTFAVPPVLFLLSFIVFSKKYRLYGELSEKTRAYVVAARGKNAETEN